MPTHGSLLVSGGAEQGEPRHRFTGGNSMRANTSSISTSPPTSASHDQAHPIVMVSTMNTARATVKMPAVYMPNLAAVAWSLSNAFGTFP